MIKKLQIKLIFAAMLSLFIVMSVILSIAGMLNYRQIIYNADYTLSILAENGGEFPKTYDGFEKNDFLNYKELPYESRYFYVELNSSNEVLAMDMEQIAAVDAVEIPEYVQKVLSKKKSNGFVNNYRYTIYTSDYKTIIIFLDCRRSLSTFKTFAVTTVIVSGLGLAAVLILLLFISGKIVKPFSENYEKQKRFITDAGHELKTPLAIINADADVLEMDIGENEWLEDIHKQTNQLAELTNSLITLSRAEEAHSWNSTAEFSLTDIAEKAADSFRSLVKSQNKTFECDIQPDINMHGDETAVRRLVSVLLDNAVKYSEEGGKISLTLKKKRNSIQLDVYNTTPSIARENLPYLFDRFYRTDKSRNSETGGYGLGLSVAASVVNSHKGKITASTSDEKSLLITVILPI